MPIRKLPSRGLAELRTLAGLADQRVPAYKAFLRVSFLELERARHDQEIGVVRRRLEFMTNRCREIDAEKSEILATAAIAPAAVGAGQSATRRASGSTPQTGFPLRILRLPPG